MIQLYFTHDLLMICLWWTYDLLVSLMIYLGLTYNLYNNSLLWGFPLLQILSFSSSNGLAHTQDHHLQGTGPNMTGAGPGPVSALSKYTKTLQPHSSSMRKIPFKPVFAKKDFGCAEDPRGEWVRERGNHAAGRLLVAKGQGHRGPVPTHVGLPMWACPCGPSQLG